MTNGQIMTSTKLIIILLLYLSLTGLTQSTLLTVGKEGANFTTIQEAIDAANPGDIIEVHGGTYLEHVNADKALVLRGIGNPVIDSNGNGSAIRLNENGIVLEGFVLTTGNQSGIEISYDDNITIRNNIIRNNSAGITIYRSMNSSIIKNNIINNKIVGLNLDGSTFCTIINNFIYNSTSGIDLSGSNENSLSDNLIVNNTNGIDLSGSNRNSLSDNLIVNNTASGVSLQNSLLSEAGPEGFSDDNLLERNQIEGSEYGIRLKYSEGNNISANRLINNEYGIYADRSLNNTIGNNEYINNAHNESSDGQSRNDIWRPDPFVALLEIVFIFVLFNIVVGGLIGIASGVSIKKVLKYSTLGLIGNAILGVIGFVLGFYSCLYVSSNLLVSFIAAAASAFILILLVEILRHPGRK